MSLPAGVAAAVSSLPAPVSIDRGILVPGRNCWRVAEARRFAVALDAQSQRRALRQSLLEARKTVFIVGWHIDSQTLLGDGQDDFWPQRLGDLLRALLLRRPGLRVYVLAWDFCMLYSGQREWPPVYRQAWPEHRRLIHRLDARHPAGGAHHQNFVVVDDAVAFVGGLDLARDTRSGMADTQMEASAGVGPGLGAQAVFDGPAAAMMGELARLRWQRSAGRRVASRSQQQDSQSVSAEADLAWPPSLAPDMYDVRVGISRTEPAYAGRPATGEIRQLFIDAIASARHTLYFENGYFTAQILAQALTSRLRNQDAPETILITQPGAAGWLDEAAMLNMRAEIHEEIQRHDRNRRYYAYCPPVTGTEGGGAAPVRSKLFIVDDELFCLGSANLSNRSMMLDTECQVTVEAGGQAAQREAIARIRARVLAARLAVTEQVLAACVAKEGIAGAIARLDPAGMELRPLSSPTEDTPAEVQKGLWVDRERPVSPDRLIAQFMPEVTPRPLAQRLLAGAVVVALILAAGGLWRWTPLSDYLNLGMLMKMGYFLKSLPYASLAVIGCYVVGGLLAMPVTVLIAASGMVFGAWQGGIYALVGTMLSALVTYALGRMLGRETVRSLAGARINALSERIAARGVLAMVVLRVLPVAPFTVVNVMAGASRIRLRDYLLGTFLGMLPGIVLTVAFANQLARMLQNPDLESVLLVTGAGLLMAGAAFAIQRMVDNLGGAGRRVDAAAGNRSSA